MQVWAALSNCKATPTVAQGKPLLREMGGNPETLRCQHQHKRKETWLDLKTNISTSINNAKGGYELPTGPLLGEHGITDIAPGP